MESLFNNNKISERTLLGKYPEVRKIGIQKINAFLKCIKHHPRKYELFQAMRFVFKEILEYYTIRSIDLKNFKDLRRVMNKIFKLYEDRRERFGDMRCDPCEDSRSFFKVSINIAYISQEARKEEEGYELYSKLCDLSTKKYDLKEKENDWKKFLKYDKKFGNVGTIYNVFKKHVALGGKRSYICKLLNRESEYEYEYEYEYE